MDKISSNNFVGQPIFKQIINLIPKNKFDGLALSHEADRYYKTFTTWNQFLTMMFGIQQDSVAFFNLINELHDKTSLVITTNKSPKEWTDVLKDPVLTTALLDRILFKCEIIKLEGKSYRMENRKTIFTNPK